MGSENTRVGGGFSKYESWRWVQKFGGGFRNLAVGSENELAVGSENELAVGSVNILKGVGGGFRKKKKEKQKESLQHSGFPAGHPREY